jgi:gliding motility-associated-like protein
LTGALSSQASHIIGAEIRYEHVTGMEYEVFVNLYGDCDGSSYPALFGGGTVAEVDVYLGASLFTSITCDRFGEYGKEITPVCPRDSLNTACNGGALPGISEFKFKKRVTLSGANANWRFVFNGGLGGTAGAGRTAAITNANTSAGNSLIYLEAKLNNLNGPNSSPVLTTIPTPFFCINQSQSYNNGASDVDQDNLQFALIDASQFDPLGNVVSIPYNAGFSGAQPLSATAFNFNVTSGQLTFSPNLIQKSVVVNEVSEFRNGVLVGTMMREMNFIVLDNCSNVSPTGGIDTTEVGKLASNTIIEVCNADSIVNFSISGFDPDSGNVTVTVSAPPTGLSYTIQNNNSPSPALQMQFVVPQPILAGDSYTFFVSFEDDNCPISSKQQQAFTIKVIEPITVTQTVLGESCIPGNDAVINLNGSSTNSAALTYSLNNGPYQVGNTFASLNAGTYLIKIKDSLGCVLSETIVIDTTLAVRITDAISKDVRCFGQSNGSIEVTAVPDTLSVQYSLLPTSLVNNTGRFPNLPKGSYSVIANAPLGCSDTVALDVGGPDSINFESTIISDNRCELNTGSIRINTNIQIPAEYSISPSQETNATGIFGGLTEGFYIITVRDSNGCNKDTLLEIKKDPTQLQVALTKEDVSCESDGFDASVQASVSGAVDPVSYFWTSIYGTEGTSEEIINQRSGYKKVVVTDAIGCEAEAYIIVDPANCCEKVFIPSAFTPNGDGVNETFNLRTPLTMNEVRFTVVNRWGQKVWETNNQLDRWDGNYPDGTPADVGTYFYALRYQCDSDKKNYFLKGDITVIR